MSVYFEKLELRCSIDYVESECDRLLMDYPPLDAKCCYVIERQIKRLSTMAVEAQNKVDVQVAAIRADNPHAPNVTISSHQTRFVECCNHAIAILTNELTTSPQPSPSVQATAKDNALTNDVITKVDAERLGSYFNAKFKGIGNNYNYFDDMIKDIQAIKIAKELAMIAVMIYDCHSCFIQRPSTFAAWMREFFEMIGRDCPKDCHKNKYRPNERIKRTFYYLA